MPSIIAIGASAGGLEALEKFFDNVPVDTGMAIVVIQHLDPNFRSMMDELLGRHAKIPIHKVVDQMLIEPNAIYLNPARQDMSIDKGRFRLHPSERTGGLTLPINCFFESAACEYGERAVAVILSGTGSDGAKGCEAIKEAGGRVFVQDPASAKFGSMPSSVIARKIADGVDLPEKLPSLITQPRQSDISQKHLPAGREANQDPLAAIFSTVKARHDIDFSVYKTATMERRIRRRMGLVNASSLSDYADLLAVSREETTTLLKDLLLDVTAFFRDPEAFKVLSEKVILPLVEAMSPERETRVWVAGCSSGEEAYSLVICFAECARALGKSLNVKILATDIHQSSLAVGSAGLYPEASFGSMPPEIVERYFDREGKQLRVKKAVRRFIVFSQHNILKDPPFTRIDLLTCRNVLIYFNEEAQQYALTLFHFALWRGGVIFLGPSETLGAIASEFKVINQKMRLFSKTRDLHLLAPGAITLHTGRASSSAVGRGGDAYHGPLASSLNSRHIMRVTNGALKEMLSRYAPPGFLLSRDGALMHVFGNAAKYITIKRGVFSQQIVDLLPRELALVVASGLGSNIQEKFSKFRRSIRGHAENGETLQTVTIEALPDPESDADYLLMTIEEAPSSPHVRKSEPEQSLQMFGDPLDFRRRNEELIADLQATEENLQAAIEELATSNEELQSTNEELMASNEELQSTNEELHSVNEELYTVSTEHQQKIDELIQLSLDIEHLLKATEIGTIFLDEKLYVRRFTPAVAQAFNLIPQDVGRPISHITLRFENVDFYALLDEVNQTRVMREEEVSVAGHSYLLRILPYRADGADLLGTVVTLIDVDERKKAQARVRELDERQQQVLSALRESILSWDARSEKILFCNDVFAHMTAKRKEEIIGADLRSVLDAESYTEKKNAVAILARYQMASMRTRVASPTGVITHRHINISCIHNDRGEIVSYIACGRDVSEETRYAEALKELSALESHIDEPIETAAGAVLDIGARFLGLEQGLLLQIDTAGERIVSHAGLGGLDHAVGSIIKLPQSLRNPGVGSYGAKSLVKEGDAPTFDKLVEAPNNGPTSYIGKPVRCSGALYGMVCFLSDRPPLYGPFTDVQRGFIEHLAQWIGLKIEARRQHEALLQSEAELRLIFDNVPANIWRMDSQHRVMRANAAAARAVPSSLNAADGETIEAQMQQLDAQWLEHDDEIMRSGQPLYGIVSHSSGPGNQRRWTSTDKIPYVDPATDERSILVVASDITALKQRETALEQLNLEVEAGRKRFEHLYQQTPVMMCSFASDGLLTEASDLWLEKTGFARDEVLGRPFGDFLDEDSRRQVNTVFLPALWGDGVSGPIPLRVVSKCDQIVEVELSAFLDKARLPQDFCLAVLIDVTERNNAIRSQEQANRELATANDGLKKFAHVASHDLQEPLRKISQFGDMIMTEYQHFLPEDGKFFVQVMRDSAERMRLLVGDILSFSKSVNASLERREVDLADVIRDLIIELEVAIRDAQAQIECVDVPMIIGDRTSIQQLFRNLLTNSLKYRRPNVAPRILISCAGDPAGAMVISVADNGCGFDSRYEKTIFEAFTRLHTASQIEGSGIGLAICKSVCDRHSWTISVKTVANQGTEFLIAIPAIDVVEK
ncbi:PAS domain S-box-containing protein [Rhodoblastus acidophilus]|uniref:chemotaxis protein CheB n=1 Tax=Rhodoblastus acidophilus TaxID=1074 RepID=UPI002224F7E0|nr:chemotaxis protein CheB [Rhodoblastus acidophilus]MCW2286171.1 PAS domain S-box-containing protein [Rhodoblastus acidophilus]MCW2335065.1 PAS domain S-box-containing protein [Rhodoblastus acidophilus]